MRNLSTFTPAQIPQHLVQDAPRATPDSEYPIFVEFLQKYYDFLGGYTVDVERMRDVASAPEQLLQFFSSELSPSIDSRKVLIDERKFLPLVRNVYRRKGTVSAVELLFRLFYNEAVQVYEPQKQVLKASDGKWFQEKSITVKRTYAAPEIPVLQGTVTLNLRSVAGEFNVTAERYEYIDPETVRFYFRVFSRLFIVGDEQVTIYSGKRVAFRGVLIKSPARILVAVPGKHWRVGQAFVMPGSKDDTVARVTRVGTKGEVLDVEIVHHGFEHPVGQTVRLSPYPNTPYIEDVEWDSEVTGFDGPTGEFKFAHTGKLTSGTNNITEAIRGIRWPSSDPYFSEDYAALDFNGDLVMSRDDVTGQTLPTVPIVRAEYVQAIPYFAEFYVEPGYVGEVRYTTVETTIQPAPVTPAPCNNAQRYLEIDQYFAEDYVEDNWYAGDVITDGLESSCGSGSIWGSDWESESNWRPEVPPKPALTYNKWVESLASFYFDYDFVVTYRGKYLTDSGQLSNSNIRMQDNFFYQLYSYVIQSSQEVAKFRSLLGAVHPAGIKYFAELSKSAIFAASKSITGSVGDLKVWLDEGTDGTEESHDVHFHKMLESLLEPISDDSYVDYTKVLDDSTPVTDRLMPYAKDELAAADALTPYSHGYFSEDYWGADESSQEYFAEIYTQFPDRDDTRIHVIKPLAVTVDHEDNFASEFSLAPFHDYTASDTYSATGDYSEYDYVIQSTTEDMAVTTAVNLAELVTAGYTLDAPGGAPYFAELYDFDEFVNTVEVELT